MQYFNESNFEDFRKDLKEYMTSFYLNSLVNRTITEEKIEINPNDKLVNKEEIISLFKKNAEYMEVTDPEDGYTEKKWVVNKDFIKQCEENYDHNKREPLLIRQEEFQEQIYQQVAYEKSQGMKLPETSALDLLEKLSLTAVHQTQSRKDLNIRIVALADDVEEIKDLRDRVRKESPYIVNKQLLGNVKGLSEEMPQNNKMYSLFNEELKKEFSDVFFDKLNAGQKIHYIATLSTLDRGESSLFLADLIKDERMNKVDILKDEPDYLINFVNYDGIFKNLSTYLLKNKNDLEPDKIGRLIDPIKTLIQIGATELDIQKEQLQKSWDNFYDSVSGAGDEKLKVVANKIEGLIDLYNFEREEKVERNSELRLAREEAKSLHGEIKKDNVVYLTTPKEKKSSANKPKM